MSNSFSVQDTGGGALTDMADYGLTVVGGQWPFVPTPQTDTVNVPSMSGGYTYTNEATPNQFTLTCALDAREEGGTLNDLYQLMDTIFDALPSDQYLRIYLDGLTDRYWTGVRVSGVSGVPIAGHALIPFDIVFQLDSPEPTMVGT